MPFRDHDMLVIELGSHTCRATLSLAESLAAPQHRFPSRVALLPSGAYLCAGDLDAPPEEAADHPRTPISPLVAGQVADWPALTALLSHILYTLTDRDPASQPISHPVLVLVPPNWPAADKERLTQLFFQVFRVQAFTAVEPALAAVFACASLSGLVVDIGYEKAEITAVLDSAVVPASRQTLRDVSGQALTRHLLSLLQTSPPLDQATQHPLPAEQLTLELAEEIKCSAICEVLTGKAQQAAAAPDKATEDEGVLDIAAVVASGKTREYLARAEAEKQRGVAEGGKKQVVIPNAQLSHNTLLLARGQTIVVDGARFRAAENVLQSGTLANAVYAAIHHPAIEAARRHELWENIVIVGLGSRIAGFKEAFLMQLQDRFASTGQLNTQAPAIYDPYGQPQAVPLGAYPAVIRAIKIPAHFPEWHIKDSDLALNNAADKGMPEEAMFLGAQIIAHIAFTDTSHASTSSRNYLDRSMYSDLGPAAIHAL